MEPKDTTGTEFLPDRSKRGLHDGTSAIKRARFLMRTLGIKCAAGFLRNRGFSCEFALYTLLGK